MSVSRLPGPFKTCTCSADNSYEIPQNYSNIQNIRNQIELKKSPIPFYATSQDALSVITDYDTFPYPRYFRGVPASIVPIVAEREAGWRPVHPEAYANTNKPIIYPKCVIGCDGPQYEPQLSFLTQANNKTMNYL